MSWFKVRLGSGRSYENVKRIFRHIKVLKQRLEEDFFDDEVERLIIFYVVNKNNMLKRGCRVSISRVMRSYENHITILVQTKGTSAVKNFFSFKDTVYKDEVGQVFMIHLHKVGVISGVYGVAFLITLERINVLTGYGLQLMHFFVEVILINHLFIFIIDEDKRVNQVRF